MIDTSVLVGAARDGSWLDCATGADGPEVDATDLRRLCLGRSGEVDPGGIRLRNAVLRNPLDLAGVSVPFPIHLDRCRLESPVQLDGAEVHQLSLTNCPQLPGLIGNGLTVRRDLNLSGSVITGAHRTTASESRAAAVWLCESSIGGRLLGVDTTLRPDAGARALQADRMRVGGTIRFIHEFTADGEIRLLGVVVSGSLDLTGAAIGDGSGLALDLGAAEIGGGVFLIAARDGRRAAVRGRLDMGSARIDAQFLIRDATITMPTGRPEAGGYSSRRAHGTAISAPRLFVGNDLGFEGRCSITGGIDLAMSELGSVHVGPDCRLRAPGSIALDLTNAEIRSNVVVGCGAAVAGTLRLTGGAVHGNLVLQGAAFDQPAGRSVVAAQAAVIDGDASLQDLAVATGKVNFRGATIRGALDLGRASLHNPAGQALSLHQATVGASLRLVDGFRATGKVLLSRAVVDGRLDFRGGTVVCPGLAPGATGDAAVEAVSMVVRGGMYLGWREIGPSIRLTGSSTSILADDPRGWPVRYEISGLRYDRFGEPESGAPGIAWSAEARRSWLAGQAGFDAGPYEQVARVFRQHGYLREAEDILIAQRRMAAGERVRRERARRRPLAGAVVRLRDEIFHRTVGYGYRPGRVLWMLVGLLAAVLLTLYLPAGRDTFRATDPQGNVYAATGRIVTVADPPRAPAGIGYATTGSVRPVPDACGQGQVRCFSPVFYAVDTVIPLVSLGQRTTWYPNRAAPWGVSMDLWLNVATMLGWILSSIFLLSFTRLARTL